MTDTEAIAEAWRRWGPKARADHTNGVYCVGPKTESGCGFSIDSWEAAFRYAQEETKGADDRVHHASTERLIAILNERGYDVVKR